MAFPVVAGGTCMCSMGTAPGQITPSNQSNIRIAGKPAASIMDAAPVTNVGPCGMCQSMMNPAVAAATSAAMGVLTPQPCTPTPTGAWICQGKVRVAGNTILTSDGTLQCSFMGSITIKDPGQRTVRT